MIKLKDILTEGNGDCYQAAGRLIMEYINKGKLVHGMVNGQGSLEGKRFGHAWVEVGSKVLDHSNGKKKTMPAKLYYAMGRINPSKCKYYKYKDAAKFMVNKGHWGPWEMTGDVVMAEEIPDVKGEIGKKNLRIPNDILDKLDETITLPVEIGDIVLMGKFKNKKVVVKTIGWNEKGDLLINGKSAMRMRIVKKIEPTDDQ